MKPTPGTSLVLPLVLLGVGLLACLYGHQLATRRPQTGRRLLAADSGAAGAGSALLPGSGSSGGDSAAGGQCREAYATLLTDEAYLPGTLALVWGLQKHMRSPRAVVVLLPEAWRAERPHVGAALQALRAYVAYAPPLANPYEEGLEGASRRFETKNGSSVFMKLHFFALAAFDSVLVVDSDQLVLRSYDDIFERFDPPAFGQETYTKSQFFSSATMLIAPSFGEYVRLLAALGVLRPTADAADQGFLNAYYQDFWQHESVRNGSRHVLPWWTVAWRRVRRAGAAGCRAAYLLGRRQPERWCSGSAPCQGLHAGLWRLLLQQDADHSSRSLHSDLSGWPLCLLRPTTGDCRGAGVVG